MTQHHLETCQLPKYRGKLWTDVVAKDRPYVEWLVGFGGPRLSSVLYDHLMGLLEEGPEE